MERSTKPESIELDSIFEDINILSEYELLSLMDDTFSTLSNWYLKLKSDELVLVGNCSNQIIGSNQLIVETAHIARARNKNIQTVDGKCWLLKGEMDMVQMLIAGEPTLEQFQNGFPSNWKEIISELRDKQLKELQESVALEEADMDLESDDDTTVKKIQEQMEPAEAISMAKTVDCQEISDPNDKATEQPATPKEGQTEQKELLTTNETNIDIVHPVETKMIPELDRTDSNITLPVELSDVQNEMDLDADIVNAAGSICEPVNIYLEEIVSEGTTHKVTSIPEEKDDLIQARIPVIPRKKKRHAEYVPEKHVYMSPPRSAHESVKGYEESTPKRNYSDSEDELLKPTSIKKKKRAIKPPANTPLKSRSGRTIIKPLQYWKNEKANLTIVDEQGEKQFQLAVLK
ncbi:hypothetical protein HDV01_001075 [Terramyces sp. JEL0728]|nr:hypothetical protein HDV01_001075 [Terramyces sp. JEL0728]